MIRLKQCGATEATDNLQTGETNSSYMSAKRRDEPIILCSECCQGNLCNSGGCGQAGMWLFNMNDIGIIWTAFRILFHIIDKALTEFTRIRFIIRYGSRIIRFE